jgi:hypothetical protein
VGDGRADPAGGDGSVSRRIDVDVHEFEDRRVGRTEGRRKISS